MFDFIVLSPPGTIDAAVPIAASRAGAIGVLDLQYGEPGPAALGELERLARQGHGRFGALLDDSATLNAVLELKLERIEAIVVANSKPERLRTLVGRIHAEGILALAVVMTAEEARRAQASGADAVIAKGHEAGGWIGEQGSFVLLQQLAGELDVPIWVQGGIGLRTVAASAAAGAAGAVLDSQVLLTRESDLPEQLRAAVRSLDGSETVVLGSEVGAPFRTYHRPGLQPSTGLQEMAARLADSPAGRRKWRGTVAAAASAESPADRLFVIGQDAAFARSLAERFRTVGGIIGGLRDALIDSAAALRGGNPLAPAAPLAQSHGTEYPIVQGPMTRVSDRAEFAAAVAEAGALPFLALALMRAGEADSLLEQTRRLLAGRPWGVGILGFVPPELRAEQLEVVKAHGPPFALIAGGRPDQARQLEEAGITTYLHVPSPGLLKLYLAEGARRFVFEGRECGGHVGPRTSFVLWESMLQVLEDELADRETEATHVLFAGGIHDARSAAMVAATAATAAARGIRTGVLLGTAYLFTREAAEHGAITPTFQQAAIAANGTVLLETGPGHATRCLPSPFVEQFQAEKRRLRAANVPAEDLRTELEQLNIGRLRVAAKGADRNPANERDPLAPKLIDVGEDEQWQRGMYMIGQVASLRHEVTTMPALHEEICAGSAHALPGLAMPDRPELEPPPAADIAIIGVGCILPGAGDAETFWANILGGVDAIGEIPPQRWDWRRMFDEDPAARDKVYSRWGGFIDPVPLDPLALGLPPNSLSSIEPFQLLALITAQAALRDAGYVNRPFPRERTSVILGAGGGGADLSVGYTVRSALPSLLGEKAGELQTDLYRQLPEWTEDSFPGLLMNVAAGRIANRLDFGGTNFTVDAACASSLAAIGLAVRELQSGTSDVALAGGVDAIQNPFAYLCFSKTRALSPRGRCRPFDARADGIAISEGFATVVLKRLADAERDGDRIYAVIRGVGAASDGRDRSLTAPRVEGQMRALRRAYAQARISPSTVGLIEAHGTGTVAGDGAEIEALSTLLAEHGTPPKSCGIGSVKSMIGHTKATAGVAGLVKAALALHHGVLPPTIGVSEPHPRLGTTDSPLYVNTEPRPWLAASHGHPRRAAVSAFGFGGTDFHLVLEEYTGSYLPHEDCVIDRWPGELLLWRGTKAEVIESLVSLSEQLDAGSGRPLADIAAAVARAAAEPAPDLATLAIVAETVQDLRAKLDAARELLNADTERVHMPNGIHWSLRPLAFDRGSVAFLFPGQGSQVVDMARDLAVAFPEAREPFELADRALADRYEQPLSRYIFPPPTFSSEERERRERELTDTHVAQAALGATELAYLKVLEALGLRPGMTAGHSYGELVALADAGAMSEEQLLRLSEARGRLMAQAAAGEAGAMVAVEASPEMLAPLLADGRVVAANLNGPLQTVLSGPAADIDEAARWCQDHDIRARPLPVSCAFHSPHVAGAQRRFAHELRQAEISPPRIPVYSNTTAEAHATAPDEIVEVLTEHLTKPVDFVGEVEAMYRDGARVFVEVGPRPVLSGLIDRTLAEREHLAVPVDRPGRPALLQLLHCLAALAAEGQPVQIERLLRGRRIARLRPDELGISTQPAAPPGQWLVDGGSVRPADRPSTLPTRDEERAPVSTASTNGATAIKQIESEVVTTHGPPPVHAAVTAALAGPAEPWSAPALSADPWPAPAPSAVPNETVAGVMARYQQVMQQFLETERSVMLGYLGGVRPGPPAPAPRTIAPEPIAAAPVSAALQAAPVRLPQPLVVAPPDPPPAAEAAIAEPSNGHSPLTREEIEARLLVTVSERTGYPAEMLGLDADLEGDLGIDSIKRVEIAGTFTQSLPATDRAVLDPEQLSASRTLREVISVLEASLGVPGSAPPGEAVGAAPAGKRPFEVGPVDEERIGRFVVGFTSAPAIRAGAGLAASGAVVIVDQQGGIGAALGEALSGEGHDVLVLGTESAPRTPEDAAGFANWVRDEHDGIKALVHCAPDSDPYGGVEALFLMVQAFRADLLRCAQAGGAAVLGVTRLGGTFGIGGVTPEGASGQGAVTGFLKTLAIEWPQLRVKAVDLGPGAAASAARYLLAELNAADRLVEVGYRDGRRVEPALEAAPLAARPSTQLLDGGSVLLVTGGGRGITAEVAQMLAERHRPTLVLVGRTPLADEEPATACLLELPQLRQEMIERRRSAGEELTPALVEADCRRILHARELRRNLERLRVTGAHVEYLDCDIADEHAFASLIEGVYERHGRIDGVVHGAGVIEDRLIADKQLDSFRRVMAAKAGAARTLAAKLRPEPLRFLAFFSSVSGRFGNRGQADYAAASEVMNKLAHQLDASWPGRVVSIDWGPWRSSGMVSAALEAEFARRGVTLIPVPEGCRRLEEELLRGGDGEAEVVIGAASGLSEPTGTPEPEVGSALRLPLLAGCERLERDSEGIEVLLSLDLARHRYLDDHRVDGRPVLPFAAAMGLMAELGAVYGARVAGLHQIRVLKGIALADERPATIRLSGRARKDGSALEVTIDSPEQPRPHYRAVVNTGDAGELAEPPSALPDLRRFPTSIAEAYDEYLFHGPLFQAIAEISGMDERGSTAVIVPSDPGACVSGAAGLRWLLDPVMVDAALQIQVLWARLQWNVTLLPAEIGSAALIDTPRDGERVRHEFRVRAGTAAPMCHADHWFLGSDGRMIATLGNVVGVGTAALNRLAAARA